MKEIKVKARDLGYLKLSLDELMEKDFQFKRSIDIARFASNQVAKELELFDKQRIKLCEKMAIKDEKGNPIVINNGGNFLISNTKTIKQQIEQLPSNYPKDMREKLEKDLKINQAKDKEFKEVLNELMEIELTFEFEPFKMVELQNHKFSPKTLIVLGEMGFIEGYQKDKKEEALKSDS